MTLLEKIKNFVIGAELAAILTGCATTHTNPKPFGKIAGYYDTRGKQTATLTIGASDLPLDTKFFSFMDVATEKDSLDNLTPPYGEFRLSKKSDIGLGAAVEYNRDFSKSNGITRLGLVYEPNIKDVLENTFLGLKFYPASTDDHGTQLGLYGNTSFRDGDITLDGYLDYNFTPKKIVIDLQFGKRIKGNLYGVLEARYNGFMEKDSFGLGIGLEWKF